MAKPMGVLLSLWGRTRHGDPPIEGALPLLDAQSLLQPHHPLLDTIRQLVGVPHAHWDTLYASAFKAYAVFVQQLPASEAHHHSGPGGMLAHGLEVVREALKLRRGRLLPPGAGAEELSVQQDLWTYATATGALLHDIGKPVTDQTVQLFDRRGQTLGTWDPWAGPIPAEAAWYHPTFVRGRHYPLHERVPPLLAHFILPQRGLSWLASDQELFTAWLAVITGDADHTGVLGDLISQADGLSVANDLMGAPARTPMARRRPLSTRLLTGLRYLLDQGQLPLNRPGAAGWLLGEDLWLVSKRVLDALRDHLRQEGQEGIPTHNERLMDELQQHALLVPNNGRAVWTAEITVGEWSQRLTVLRFPVHLLWSEPDARPPTFEGTVTPVSAGQSTPSDTDRAKAREASVSTLDTKPPSDDVSEAPGPAAQDMPISETVEPARFLGVDDYDETDPGQRFLAWLKDGLRSGRLPINAANARVHVVAEGLLLVSPGIFKDFDPPHWTQAQKRFQKLKLHRRTPQATNVWSYQVSGQRKKSRINGLLIAEPTQALGLALPPPNPHLSLPE